jgi:hypothetical protein
MSRRHNRHRKQKRKARIAQEREEWLATIRQEMSTPSTRPPGRRHFTLFVKAGWSMEFETSGVPVPFDAESGEVPPLLALTLGELLKKDADESQS